MRRALVSLGLTDVGGITGRVVEILAPALEEIRLDVVVGAGAQSLDDLTDLAARDRRLRLHVDSHEMATLVADADVAVGAGGSSVWERASVGLPTVVAVLADNQHDMAARLAEEGISLVVDARADDFEAALLAAWRRLTEDEALRAALAAQSTAACDGRGAERVAAAILAMA